MLRFKALGLAGLLAASIFVSPAAAPTSHELVYFDSGGVMSVAGHRLDRDAVVLLLHGGAEVRCDPTLIDRIELDRSPRYSTAPARVESYQAYAGTRMLARPYGDLVQQASETHGVDPYLIHAIIEVESSYNATAQSHRGAMGLMQPGSDARPRCRLFGGESLRSSDEHRHRHAPFGPSDRALRHCWRIGGL